MNNKEKFDIILAELRKKDPDLKFNIVWNVPIHGQDPTVLYDRMAVSVNGKESAYVEPANG